MSALSSTSKFPEIVASYADNAAYEEDGSTTKAAAFITAVRLLLLKLPKRAEHGKAGEVEFDPLNLRSELESARTWLAAQPPTSAAGGAVRYMDFQSFRD